LVSYAGLTKECVIIGVNDRLEIWDEKTFNNFINDTSDKIEDIAESLFENASL
jgi:MraZ protein